MRFTSTGQMEQPPAGSHIARCIGIIDLGTQAHSWNNETWHSRDVRLVWELPNELMEGRYKPELKGKPFGVSLRTKQSLHPSAKLRRLLESWRGRKFTKDELTAFDPKKLLGAACRLTLIEDGDYVNVDSIAPLGRTEQCPKAMNLTTFLSLERDEFELAVFERLSNKTKELIKLSPEYKALFETPAEDDVPPEALEESAAETEHADPDIPF